MSEKKINGLFVEGAIGASLIADSIAKHSTKTKIGAQYIPWIFVKMKLREKKHRLNTAVMKKWPLKKCAKLKQPRKYSLACMLFTVWEKCLPDIPVCIYLI
jgi:hypothetical protein